MTRKSEVICKLYQSETVRYGEVRHEQNHFPVPHIILHVQMRFHSLLVLRFGVSRGFGCVNVFGAFISSLMG